MYVLTDILPTALLSLRLLDPTPQLRRQRMPFSETDYRVNLNDRYQLNF